MVPFTRQLVWADASMNPTSPTFSKIREALEWRRAAGDTTSTLCAAVTSVRALSQSEQNVMQRVQVLMDSGDV